MAQPMKLSEALLLLLLQLLQKLPFLRAAEGKCWSKTQKSARCTAKLL